MNNDNDKISTTKLANCMWSRYRESPFVFECELLFNTYSNDLEKSVNRCNECKYFQNTNIEIYGGFNNKLYNILF